MHEHKREAPQAVGCFVLTVSDTRTLETDRSGQQIVDDLAQAGHTLTGRDIVPDEPDRVGEVVRREVGRPGTQAILVTGGTGIGRRDRTYETVTAIIEKPMPGFGELFRWLSYEEIGPATVLSRAVGGAAAGTVILVMPGSSAAVRLAMDKIILPELPHMVREAGR